MNTVSQIVVHSVSLLTALFIGSFFNFAFSQAAYRLKDLFNGKPLPAATQFFIDHAGLPLYLLLLPWLWLVGGPLLARAGVRAYWNVPAFVARYLAFVASEFLLILLLACFLFLPYLPIYTALRSPDTGALELMARLAFWSVVVGLVSLSFYRRYRERRPHP